MLNESKLIMVEGIPGSGKTTQATFVKKFLDERGIPNHLYLEGDLNHPADFESVAYFTRSEYELLLTRHAAHRQMLEQNVTIKGDDCFFSYRQLELDNGQASLDELMNELAAHDVYQVPSAETYCRLALARWQAFAEQAQRTQEVSIFECCFLQNPLTVLLGQYNVDLSDAARHVMTITAAIQPLRPTLIYLWQKDTRMTLERVARERPPAWRDFLVAYFTQQGWGKAHGVSGWDGVIAFYEMRTRVELDLLRRLNLASVVIDNSDYDWDKTRQEAKKFLETAPAVE